MSKIILECCTDSVESAVAAMKGGADRIELCSALPLGGLSPQPSLFKAVKKAVGNSLKIHVLLRPRGGDFLYTPYDYEILKDEVETFRDLGADGIVIGILRSDGTVDMERCAELCRLAGTVSKTFHRAFDMSSDYMRAYEDICKLGFDTLLTSGQAATAYEGREIIKKLTELHGPVSVMPGAGVNSANIKELCEYTQVSAVHMSAKKLVKSEMLFRQEAVSMGAGNEDEFSIFRTDELEILKARRRID